MLFNFRTSHQTSAAKNAWCELLRTASSLIQPKERLCQHREQQCSCVCWALKSSSALLQTLVAFDLGLGRAMEGRSMKWLDLLRRLYHDLDDYKRQSDKEKERGKVGEREGGGEREREGERIERASERENTREYTSLFAPFSYRGKNAETTSQVRRILQPARVL